RGVPHRRPGRGRLPSERRPERRAPPETQRRRGSGPFVAADGLLRTTRGSRRGPEGGLPRAQRDGQDRRTLSRGPLGGLPHRPGAVREREATPTPVQRPGRGGRAPGRSTGPGPGPSRGPDTPPRRSDLAAPTFSTVSSASPPTVLPEQAIYLHTHR